MSSSIDKLVAEDIEANMPPRAEVQELRRLVEVTRQAAAASLAAGLIAASGRTRTMTEAMSIFQDAYFTLFPDSNSGRYTSWKATHDPDKAVD